MLPDSEIELPFALNGLLGAINRAPFIIAEIFLLFFFCGSGDRNGPTTFSEKTWFCFVFGCFVNLCGHGSEKLG